MRLALVIGLMFVASMARAQDAGVAPSCTVIDATSRDAEACAEAAFQTAEATDRRTDLRLVLPPPEIYPGLTLTQFISMIRELSGRAQRIARAYEDVMGWAQPPWTISALIRQGSAYERMLTAITTAGPVFANPALEARRMQAMEPQIAPVECLAVVRYLLAVRAARAASIDLAEVTHALARLHRYGADRIAQCVSDQRARDSSFTPFTQRDLDPLR